MFIRPPCWYGLWEDLTRNYRGVKVWYEGMISIPSFKRTCKLVSWLLHLNQRTEKWIYKHPWLAGSVVNSVRYGTLKVSGYMTVQWSDNAHWKRKLCFIHTDLSIYVSVTTTSHAYARIALAVLLVQSITDSKGLDNESLGISKGRTAKEERMYCDPC
jgi:hypothetical protein